MDQLVFKVFPLYHPLPLVFLRNLKTQNKQTKTIITAFPMTDNAWMKKDVCLFYVREEWAVRGVMEDVKYCCINNNKRVNFSNRKIIILQKVEDEQQSVA